MRRLSTIIVDGDAGSRDHLRELCKNHTELELVAECSGADEARNVILARLPDLAFLSVRINGASGIQLARELPEGAVPLLVFVSAHDQNALQAFEIGAVDYILKPVSYARFCETVQRALARARACIPESRPHVRQPAHEGSIANIADRATPLTGCHRFILEIGDRVHLVDISDIESIEADRNYVWINGAQTYRVRSSLKELQELLPGDSFFRVNRSVIVNSRCIASIERRAHGEYAIQMCSGGIVTTGRRFKAHIPGVILRRQA